VDAAIELWRERWYDDITLQEIADRAAVSLSTVMRRFGSKEGVVDAILASDRLGTWGRRRRIATGDIGAAVRELVGDFVLNGDGVIRDLALEQQLPAIRHAVEIGRRSIGNGWCRCSPIHWLDERAATTRADSPNSWPPPTCTAGNCSAATTP
jgi:AcrR family transcriptional regulator